MNDSILNLASRMKNDFFVGVVGPTRSGKSTLINKFFENLILPYIDDEFIKNKILDELPQTSSGKLIMTVEPKFIPMNPVKLTLDDKSINVRFVDCVGEVIKDAEGYGTKENPRMIKTPWFSEPISFLDAASIGTIKVMENHASLGFYVTSDGTFGDFCKTDYKQTDEILIPKLKALNKPFVILLNTYDINSIDANTYKEELEEKYDVNVVIINALNLDKNSCNNIMNKALEEFNIEELSILLPSYIDCLDENIKYKKDLDLLLLDNKLKYRRIKDVNKLCDNLKQSNLFSNVHLDLVDLNSGKVDITLNIDDNIYNNIIFELTEGNINTRSDFINYLYKNKKYNNILSDIEDAYNEAIEKGYGLFIPDAKNLNIEKPTLVKKNGMYGIKLSAIAKTIHMISCDTEASFTPIVGSLDEANMVINNLNNNEELLLNMEFFGKKLTDIVSDSLKSKVNSFKDKHKDKLTSVIDKIMNKNHNNLIAIVL